MIVVAYGELRRMMLQRGRRWFLELCQITHAVAISLTTEEAKETASPVIVPTSSLRCFGHLVPSSRSQRTEPITPTTRTMPLGSAGFPSHGLANLLVQFL